MAEAKKKAKSTTVRKKKAKLNFTKGICHIHASYNNTIVSISDEEGKVIAWASAGTCKMTGARKSTPFAAQMAAERSCGSTPWKALNLSFSIRMYV